MPSSIIANSQTTSRPDSPASKKSVLSTAPTSPMGTDIPEDDESGVADELRQEEERARLANERAEQTRLKRLAAKRKREKGDSKEQREMKARQLDDLLNKSAAFSDVLTKKTEVLGRVGSGFDGQALGEHNLTMAKQPKIMKGGTMRDYQLEGLTWMFEICAQGMSGILADEMGLGKTIQTISLIALLREQENYLGPHLIVAPLSTLSNWMDEFQKWVPDIPIVLYHGTPAQRSEIREKKMMKHLHSGRPTAMFPVVCTSYEMVLKDSTHLSKINWEFIIIDEGHRLKNAESKLFNQIRQFTSATRLLITGTPLQNNLTELWSLLHFLLPNIFTNLESFESWFDFSDLQDEEGAQEFVEDEKKKDLIKKLHLILQPLLLRRVKSDVASYLPKKREYVLYAPLTREQGNLYHAITDRIVDTRQYLEDQVVSRLSGQADSQVSSRSPSMAATPKSVNIEESDSEDDIPLQKLALRGRQRQVNNGTHKADPKTPMNAFQKMMSIKKESPVSTRSSRSSSKSSTKRKLEKDPVVPKSKSTKSSRKSTPSRSSTKIQPKYVEAEASEEDELSDDEFESRLAKELARNDEVKTVDDRRPEDITRAKIVAQAKKEISTKKLGNDLMQLRLTCNSPHNFYNPWSLENGLGVDETLVTSSGKMLLLDRLLEALFSRGHKVLIFSQFKTQLDLIEDYARELRKWPMFRIDGSVAQQDRQEYIKTFNNDPDYRLFLLSTRAGGQGINLASADTVILFDSDFNPQQDLQAQDRAHRIGQKNPVIVYRLATRGTVEDELLRNADAKRRLEKLVIKKGGFKTMGQKMDKEEGIGGEDLRALLERDGEVFERSSNEILSEKDLEILLDRSDEAFEKAEKGASGSKRFENITTSAGGFMAEMK